MRYYDNKVHEVVKMSLDNLRASRFWEEQADEARAMNEHNHYGIDYALNKADKLKSIAYVLYDISKQMRTAQGQRKVKLFNQAQEVDWEAYSIENDY